MEGRKEGVKICIFVPVCYNSLNASFFHELKTEKEQIERAIINLPSIHMPLFASLALLFKSSNESTVNTLLGPDAIWLSSESSTSFPIPKTNTGDPFLWRREDAISRGVYTPSSAVCFPVVITKTG